MNATGNAAGGRIGPSAFFRSFLWADVLAGLTLGGMFAPQGLAYAGMARKAWLDLAWRLAG